MSKSLLPMLAGAGLIAATGGLATPAVGAGAAGGTAAMAGDTLAGAGAAGLLGGAGATAAGYGAPLALGEGATMGLGAAGNTGIDATTASFGPNGEYTGNTIASELSPNAYTGGYDSLNGLERMGQRVSGFLDDGGLGKLNKFKGMMTGQQEQQPQAQNKVISGGAVQSQEPSQMGAPVYGQGIQLTEEQKRMMLAQLQAKRGYL